MRARARGRQTPTAVVIVRERSILGSVSAYREPARTHRAPLELPGPAARSMATLASLAGLAGASALAVGHVELLALAGAGAAAAALSAVRAASARWRTSALERFLDTDAIVEGPGTWTTPDGARRIRTSAGDPYARWERLDPATGETLASYRAPAPIAPPAVAAEVIDQRAAPVYGRAREPRCFVGLPPEVKAPARTVVVDARALLLLVRRDGVLVERRDGTGELIGDTLHPDLPAAMRQIEAEYGDRIGAFRAAERDLPIARESLRTAWDGPTDTRLAL